MSQINGEPRFRLASRQTLLNVGALFSGTAVARVFSALSIFIIARQLGLDNFGLYTAALSLAKLTSVVFSLGLDSWLLRNGGRESQRLGWAAGSSLAIKVGLGAIWLLLLAIVSPLLNQDAFPFSLVMLSAVSIWFDELGNTAWSTLKASLRNHIAAWLIIVSQLLILAMTIVVAQLGTADPAAYLWGRVAASVAGSLLSLFITFRLIQLRIEMASLLPTVKDTVSFALSHALAIIYERADITIVAAVLGKTAAGIYSPAVSLMTTLYLIPTAVYEVMLPILSRMHATQPKKLKQAIFRFTLVSCLMGIVLGVGLAIIAYPLVWIVYTAQYIMSAGILVILSNVLIFKCISFGLASVLAAVGWQGRRVKAQAISAAINILLNLIVIHFYSITGVAYVYVLSEAVLMMGYLVLVLRWQHQEAKTQVQHTRVAS